MLGRVATRPIGLYIKGIENDKGDFINGRIINPIEKNRVSNDEYFIIIVYISIYTAILFLSYIYLK